MIPRGSGQFGELILLGVRHPWRAAPFALLLLLLMVPGLFLTGCQGRQSPVAESPTESPEIAVRKLLAAWSQAGKPVSTLAQTSSDPASATNRLGTITFRDLSGTDWAFEVVRVEYPGEGLANVHTSYAFRILTTSTVNITFKMIREIDGWKIDDIVFESLPLLVVSGLGVQGFITDFETRQPLVNAAVALYQGDVLVDSTLTGADGFYSVTAATPGIYTLVVTRDGFEFLTVPNITIL